MVQQIRKKQAAHPDFGGGVSVIGGVTLKTQQALDFLARTSGLDATHTNAYIALIDGLVSDGVWAKFDLLHVYATQDTTTAQLNLVSASFPATLNGSPTFTADRGYTGVDASSTVYINTGFNPTSGSPKHTQNSAHLSEWNLTNTTSGKSGVGSINGAQTQNAYILSQFTDNHAYFRINVGIDATHDVAVADAIGHYIGNRSSSSASQGYKNGSSILSNAADTSVALTNQNFYGLAYNFNGTASGVGHQIAMISIGSSMNSTEAANFYNRLRTYMTAVGVP